MNKDAGVVFMNRNIELINFSYSQIWLTLIMAMFLDHLTHQNLSFLIAESFVHNTILKSTMTK